MNSNLSMTTITPIHADTLDHLWHEAEQLGVVKVDPAWRGDNYEVTIRFQRKSGTSITAMGKNPKVAFALADAINEAREMGAGTEQ